MTNEIRNDPVASDKEAMDLICSWASPTNSKFPSALKNYFENKENNVKVIVNPGNELERNFEATYLQKILLKQCGPIQAGGEKYKATARVVPMVTIEPARTGAPFQAGRFATIDLAVPGLVLTPQLTGCCLVIGFDKDDSTRMYIGHAKGKDRKELVKKMKELKPEEMFEGISNVKKMEFFGGEKEGYDNGSAEILGWVSGNKFFLGARIEYPGYTYQFKVLKYPSNIVDTVKSAFKHIGGTKSN